MDEPLVLGLGNIFKNHNLFSLGLGQLFWIANFGCNVLILIRSMLMGLSFSFIGGGREENCGDMKQSFYMGLL
jgi:hypothetical protein